MDHSISLDGAGLIAQVIPVALLIFIVERRWVGPVEKRPGARGAFEWWAVLLLQALLIGLSLWVEWECIVAVSLQTPIGPDRAWVVDLTLYGIGFAVFTTLLSLLSHGYLGRETARANVRRADRRRWIVDRAHRVAKMERRDLRVARRVQARSDLRARSSRNGRHD
ncbi:MAG: hypothetical protein JWM23_574 [Microbacteriaceae bacterium]|nr:hypothetical protein [Microbacteriaceae bacterium]